MTPIPSRSVYLVPSSNLSQSLLSGLPQPAFCSTLLEINALCYELRTGDNTRLMAQISPNFTPVDTFLDEQSTQRTHAAKAFEQIVDKLQALVEKVRRGEGGGASG